MVSGVGLVEFLLAAPGWRYLVNGADTAGWVIFVGTSIVLVLLFHKIQVGRTRLETQVLQLTKARGDLFERTNLLDLAQDSILSLQMNGAIEFWNRGAEQNIRLERCRSSGPHFPRPVAGRLSETLPEIQRTLIEQGAWQGEVLHTKKDGANSWC